MENPSLAELLESVKEYGGLTRKASIGPWARRFVARARMTPDVYGPGDDAGAVRMDGGFLLLSGEGLWPGLLADPEFAGFCAVTVNVNDIYAMGGRPLGLVTVVFEGGMDEVARDAFLDGIECGLDHYKVPLLGGHTSPEGEAPAVAVCIAGRADNLLRADGARPGDAIVAALDLDGERHHPFHVWDSVTSCESSTTMGRLETFVEIADRRLASACRDVSNPGILGTIAMMLEASRAGGTLDLDALPVPDSVDLDWWLKAYPSFGFVLAARPDREGEMLALLRSRGITCERIGEVREGSSVAVTLRGEIGTFTDWENDPVTGIY
jgi:selenophosphate synthetase-related protein